MTFEKWLMQFKKQQTPIGDLARDFINSKYSTIEESFERFSPCYEALETYKKARKSYILELANNLHDELYKILEGDKSEPSIWHESIDTLYNLQDILVDLDSYLDESNEGEQ